MKIFISLFFSFCLLILIFQGCQNATETTYENAHIKGYIVDSITRNQLDSVNVSVTEISETYHTSGSGYFQFLNIHMPRPTWTVTLVADKNGYIERTLSLNCAQGDTINVQVGMKHN
jgi:hypothetical protein